MTAFILCAILLIAGALVLLLPPLLRSGKKQIAAHDSQSATALSVLREQLAELETERTTGEIDETSYAQSREELERRALEEGTTDTNITVNHDSRPSRSWAVAIALFIPVLATITYLFLGNPDGLDPEKVASKPPGLEKEQIAAMVDKLAAKLEQEPGDAEGWMMLAHAYYILEDFPKAATAFSRLSQLLPDNPDVLVDWAETIAIQKKGFDAEARALLLKALEIDSMHPKGLTLAGGAAFEHKEYKEAAAYWERILAQIPPGETEIAKSLLVGINQARAQAGLPPLSLSEQDHATSSSAITLSGRVEIAPALQDQTAPDDTVFIFVRGNSGGPPLAALRFKVSELPRDFSFDGAPLMIADSIIPNQLTVAARISKTDKIATAQPGDLEGQVTAIAPNATGINLHIDRVRH